MTVTDVMAVIGPFLGFFSGWGLTELTERGKIRRGRDAMRQALVVELQRAELRLSTAVSKYAYLADTPEVVARVAAEIRWFVRIGEARAPGTGVTLADVPATGPEQLCALPDAVMVQLFATHTARESVGTKYLLPVLDSTLAGNLMGFSAIEVQALSELGSQMHMLSQQADWSKELWHQTFTATEPNYTVTLTNHTSSLRGYALRARVALDCTRAALKALGAEATYPAR